MSDRVAIEESTISLSNDFKDILKVWDDLETTSLSQISPEYQVRSEIYENFHFQHF